MIDAIIISDIHIGASNCQAKLLVDFLEKIHNKEILTKKLILNGDVFENFNSRLHKWNWKILSVIRSISDEIEVIWLRGNHDAYGPAYSIANLIGAVYDSEYVFTSGEKRVICIHGDIFDDFISTHPIITYFADWIYWFLQKIDNSFFLAKLAKHSSKTFLRCAAQVEELAIKHMNKKECDIICLGHVHLGVIKDKYCNSGTWTEIPPTYLTVEDGKVELKTWTNENTDNSKEL